MSLGGTMANLLEDDLAETSILSDLADWLETYLHETEPYAAQWWDLYLEERDFWDNLPSLLEALLRRGYVRPPSSLL